jgi:hypothetical protein
MSKKSPPPKTAAEVERRRKIGKGTSRFWASPKGQELKEKMRRERTGVETEAHKQAMIRAAQRLLGIVEAEEGPRPGWVTDEERQIAAREEPPAGR